MLETKMIIVTNEDLFAEYEIIEITHQQEFIIRLYIHLENVIEGKDKLRHFSTLENLIETISYEESRLFDVIKELKYNESLTHQEIIGI